MEIMRRMAHSNIAVPGAPAAAPAAPEAAPEAAPAAAVMPPPADARAALERSRAAAQC